MEADHQCLREVVQGCVLIRMMPWWQSIRQQVKTQAPRTHGQPPGQAHTALFTMGWRGRPRSHVCPDNTTTTNDQNQAFSTTQAPCDYSCQMRDGFSGRGVYRGPVLLLYDSASSPQVVGEGTLSFTTASFRMLVSLEQ